MPNITKHAQYQSIYYKYNTFPTLAIFTKVAVSLKLSKKGSTQKFIYFMGDYKKYFGGIHTKVHNAIFLYK